MPRMGQEARMPSRVELERDGEVPFHTAARSVKISSENYVEGKLRARETAAHISMKAALLSALIAMGICPLALAAEPPPAATNAKPLFDGKTLSGWEGDAKLWRVQDGALTGGSLTETVKQNEFLATTRDFTNFI